MKPIFLLAAIILAVALVEALWPGGRLPGSVGELTGMAVATRGNE